MRLTLSAAVAAAVALVAPVAASAATLTVDPAKPCYGTGERVSILGTGYSPNGTVTISRNGTPLDPPLPADAMGAVGGTLTLAQTKGRENRTYAATDNQNPMLTASLDIVVSAVNVALRPQNGPPGRRLRIRASGFTTGKRLWAHIRRGRFKRDVRIGRLKRACHNLKVRRRLLPRNAGLGFWRVQFDTFRRYKKERQQFYRYVVEVKRVPRPPAAASAAATAWHRVH
jgi:hypothetical protein